MTSEEGKRPNQMSLPELDAAVEREVFGAGGDGGDEKEGGPRPFSTSSEAARELRRELESRGFGVTVEERKGEYDTVTFRVAVEKGDRRSVGVGQTGPVALCRAAVTAVRPEPEAEGGGDGGERRPGGDFSF